MAASALCGRSRADRTARPTPPLPKPSNVRRGVLFSSSFEFPGRYTRWDMGFVDPPLVFTTRARRYAIEALNRRGRVLLPAIAAVLSGLPATTVERSGDGVLGEVGEAERRFAEEERSRQPSVFSVLRALIRLFGNGQDQHLGFYGAFGYDLVFQFEPMPLKLPRPLDQRDLVLYLPDEILVVDHMRQLAAIHRYEFEVGGETTAGTRPRRGPRPVSPRPGSGGKARRKRSWARRISGHRRARPGCLSPRRSVRGGARAAVRRALRATRRLKCSSGCAGSIRRLTAR